MVRTWSNVMEVRVQLILARLSFALLWQAVRRAAQAEGNQQPCQPASGHFCGKVGVSTGTNLAKKARLTEKEIRERRKQRGILEQPRKAWTSVPSVPSCRPAAGAPDRDERSSLVLYPGRRSCWRGGLYRSWDGPPGPAPRAKNLQMDERHKSVHRKGQQQARQLKP